MTKTEKIQELVLEELKEANKVHPMFHSRHEAYAVIKEEVEETEENISAVKRCLDRYWGKTKIDICENSDINVIRMYAVEIAREAIQVAAMCQKTLDSLNECERKNMCKGCKHFIGMGDWNLCCDIKQGLYYADTDACELFERSE